MTSMFTERQESHFNFVVECVVILGLMFFELVSIIYLLLFQFMLMYTRQKKRKKFSTESEFK